MQMHCDAYVADDIRKYWGEIVYRLVFYAAFNIFVSVITEFPREVTSTTGQLILTQDSMS